MNKCIGVIAGKSGDAITSELHKSGYEVAIICGKENENGTATADYVLIEDLREHEKIMTFFNEHNVKHVILGTGHRFAIELGVFLTTNGFELNVDLDVVKFCKNKYITKQYLEKCGLNTPHSLLINKHYFNEEIRKKVNMFSLPVVLKSITDVKEPQLINDPQKLYDEIDALFVLEDEVMIEEYIKGSDCTVVVCVDGNDVSLAECIYYSKGKEDQLIGFDESIAYKLDKNVENLVVDMAKKAILAVKAKGLARVDFIVKDGEIPYILEINTIIASGTTGSAYTAKIIQRGINRAALLVAVALNTFALKNDRRSTIGYIYDEDEQLCKQLEHMDILPVAMSDISNQYINHVQEDLIWHFKAYAETKGYKINSSEVERRFTEILIFIIKCNFDYIINNVSSKEKEMLDLVIDYLNIPRYE